MEFGTENEAITESGSIFPTVMLAYEGFTVFGIDNTGSR
jgi:hypothetical protein